MKSFFIHLSLLLSSITVLSAQTTLKGTVLDTKTKEPVAFANVYLDGTTIGTATDLDGRFSLTVKNRIHTRLVVSFMGYESVVISNPYESIPEIIYLDEKDINLDEVIVRGKPTFTEKQKMKAFREQFLGMSIAGNSCKVLNEDVIRLVYEPETHKLHGYTDAPLEIENRYLGYRIRWEIIEFNMHLKSEKSLHDTNIDTVLILGIAAFEDIKKNSIFHENRRKEVYKFSLRRFFKLLADQKISESDFTIFDKFVPGEVLKPLLVTNLYTKIKKSMDNSSMEIVLNPKKKDSMGAIAIIVTNIVEDSPVRHYEKKILRSPYNDSTTKRKYKTCSFTRLYFTADTFIVDEYGNTDLAYTQKLRLSGTMGDQRVGDMLPLDYIPSQY